MKVQVSRAAMERAAKCAAIQQQMIDVMDGEFHDSDAIQAEFAAFGEFMKTIRAVHTMGATIEIEVTA